MSPVEPSPLVIGRIGLPSTDGMVALCFLPKTPAAFNSGGANSPPLMLPSAAKNDRRLQPNFKVIPISFQNVFCETNSLKLPERSSSPPTRCRQSQSTNLRESIPPPCTPATEPCPAKNRFHKPCSVRRTALCVRQIALCRSA